MKKLNIRHKKKVSNKELIGYSNNYLNSSNKFSLLKCKSAKNLQESVSYSPDEILLIKQLLIEREKKFLEKYITIDTKANNIKVNKNDFLDKEESYNVKASRDSYLSIKITNLLHFSESENSSKQIKVNCKTECKNIIKGFEKIADGNEVSYDFIIKRDTCQRSKNNQNVKTDNTVKESLGKFSLKDKGFSYIRDNTKKKGTLQIYRKKSLISKQKFNLIENFTNEKTNEKFNFNQNKKRDISGLLKTKYDFGYFPSVEKLVKMYTQRLPTQNNEGSKLSEEKNVIGCPTINSLSGHSKTNFMSDEGCQSGSSNRSNSKDNEQQLYKIYQNKLTRTYSRDSSLNADDEISNMIYYERRNSTDSVSPINFCYKKKYQERRNTLTITDIPLRTALLPLPQPIDLPDSSNLNIIINEHQQNIIQLQNNVPTKVLIKERIVEIPHDMDLLNIARRESSQSCSSEYTNSSEYSGKRYVRTPSVVVSDYSDDVMCGITLEEIEYFKKQRMRRRSYDDTALTEKDDTLSDLSGASSCSNLNYCGSTISILDGAECYINGIRTQIQRNNSEASLCSYSSEASCNEHEDNLKIGICTNNFDEICNTNNLIKKTTQEVHSEQKSSGWRKVRNIVQWAPFFQTYKKQRYPWVQLAGHQGNFKAGPEQGTILKTFCSKEELCFKILMKDVLRPYVPEFKGQVTSEDGKLFLQLEDLLSDFNDPCVMDCKIGVRTYLEEELLKAKARGKIRKDMYDKMVEIDPSAPNKEEHATKGVTKPRYMVWRETISSTATLGFRIEGIKRSNGTSSKDFKTTKSIEQIKSAFKDFVKNFPISIPRYLQRLTSIRATLECSLFFQTHEVIGSSLLFVHDENQANVWLIDFAKTVPVPMNNVIDHNTEWKVGNHEDGYLIGLNNLIEIFYELNRECEPILKLCN